MTQVQRRPSTGTSDKTQPEVLGYVGLLLRVLVCSERCWMPGAETFL